MSDLRLVLYAHGSRDPRWRATFEQLTSQLKTELGADRVDLAYLQFTGPSLDDVVLKAVGEGVRRVRVLPLFISAGGHVDHDIPVVVAALGKRFPDLTVELLPPVGEDPRLRALLTLLAAEAAQ